MKTLAEIFNNRTTSDINTPDADAYYWYLDENNQPLGISKTITATEHNLINLNYMSINTALLNDPEWHNFLTNKNASSIPDFSHLPTVANFIFCYHTLDSDLQQDFTELVGGFSPDFKLFFLEPNFAVILNLSDDPHVKSETEDFLLAVIADFDVSITFYQTKQYQLNQRLPDKFNAEFELFKKFRSNKNPLLSHKDIFLNYLMSSEIVSAYPIFGDWFSSLLTLDSELLAVVKCYLEHGFNVTTGAKIMHMHRNTFMNKLDRFIEATDLDVKNFNDATIAYLLIRLRRDI